MEGAVATASSPSLPPSFSPSAAPSGNGGGGGGGGGDGGGGHPRTFVVRTLDASPLRVTVPSTTTEALAMNRSIQDKVRQDATARQRTASSSIGTTSATAAAASEALQATAFTAGECRETGEQGTIGMGEREVVGAGSSDHHNHNRQQQQEQAQGLMMVTPNPRSKSLKIRVPATTAEALEMNKAMRSRFREPREERGQPATHGPNARDRLTGWGMAKKRQGGKGGGGDRGGGRGGGGGGSGWQVATARGNHAAEGRGGGWGAKRGPSGAPPVWTVARLEGEGEGDGDVSFDRTILKLSRDLQWSKIIRLWTEVREIRGGNREGRSVRRFVESNLAIVEFITRDCVISYMALVVRP